jgi:23S rRNA (pseudouridine1915-N3)-methyltransferase
MKKQIIIIAQKYKIMKIFLLSVGKTNSHFIKDGVADYIKRLKHYTNFEIIELNAIKNSKILSKSQLLEREGLLILKNIHKNDFLVILDEKGQNHSSIEFSNIIRNYQVSGKKKIYFVIGGAFGFSEAIYNRSNEMLSLSKMTFSHQMIRLFFVEQLYRAFTILNNEPYHHK